jgi:short-subunit dehydrogenase
MMNANQLNKKEYILITGATSGIGYEMAFQLAEKMYPLILVARNEDNLKKMKLELYNRYRANVQWISKDLSDPNQAKALYEEIKLQGWSVSHLVNNAGFGGYGSFTETSLEEEIKMINLNVLGVVILTKLFAQEMVARKSGRIMNVASLLSFIPFPYYSIYSASKTFILAFSETIAAELENSGVVVTTLCPGTVETPFHTPEMQKTNAMKANKPVPASVVAKKGIALLLNGKGKKIVGFNNWVISNLPRITPDFVMMKIKKNLASLRQ